MKPIHFYDRIEMGKPVRTPQGFLRIPTTMCRTGIQIYKTADGKTLRIYRSPEEVFKQSHMDSLRNIPVTKNHIAFVDPKNFQDLAIGMGGDSVKKVEEKFLEGEVTITTQRGLDAIEKEGFREVSCGYLADLDLTPGKVMIDGKEEAFDGQQRNLEENHLALVDVGRAGPKVRLHIDSEKQPATFFMDGIEFENFQEEKMIKIKLADGKEYEVAQEVADAIAAEQAAHKTVKDAGKALVDKANDLQKQLDTVTGERDGLKTEVTKLNKKVEDGTKMEPAKLKEMVKDRVGVIAVAHCILPKEQHKTLDGLEEMAIMKLVINANDADETLDGKSNDYVKGVFNTIKKNLGDKLNSEAAMGSILNENRAEGAVEDGMAEEQARKKKLQDNSKKVTGYTRDMALK